MNAVFSAIVVLTFGCRSEFDKNRKFILEDGNYLISSYQLDTSASNFFLNPLDTIYFSTDPSIITVPDSLKWLIKNLDDHFFTIQSVHSNKYLSIIHSAADKGTIKLGLADSFVDENQIWVIHKFKGEKFKIINKKSLSCLSYSEVTHVRYAVDQRTCNNRPGEYWRISEKAD